MQPQYRIQIITPQGIAYLGEVIHALIPAEDGFVGVLANHAPYVTSSSGGKLEVREKDLTEKSFRVGPGFFTISKNQASFLTQSFEPETPSRA